MIEKQNSLQSKSKNNINKIFPKEFVIINRLTFQTEPQK